MKTTERDLLRRAQRDLNRAYESAAATPGVEARIYVRSLAEAFVALDMVMVFAHAKRTLVAHDKEKAMALAKETESFVAVELTNGSLVSFRPELPARGATDGTKGAGT